MPFDALIAAPRQKSLSEIFDELGLTPVSATSLVDHKRAQLAKFGPSFWYRHQAALSIGLIIASPAVGAVAGAAQGFTPHSSALAVASSFAWMCMVALIAGTGLIKLRAGSHWEERFLTGDQLAEARVPEPIARIARTVTRKVPEADLVLGELKRELVVLDPYLLIELDDERVCIGVWDGDQVIASAQG